PSGAMSCALRSEVAYQLPYEPDNSLALGWIGGVGDDRDLVDQTARRQARNLISGLGRSTGHGEPFDQVVGDRRTVLGSDDHVLVVLVLLADLADDLHRRRVEGKWQVALQNAGDVRLD